MKTKVQRWGHSLAVRIPEAFGEELGLKDGSQIEMRSADGGLLLKPCPEWAPSLDELLDGVRESNLHREIVSGGARGLEAW